MALKEIVEGKLWEWENFLTEDEVSTIMDVVLSVPDSAWYEEDLPDYDMHHAGKTLQLGAFPHVREVTRKIDNLVASMFSGADRMTHIGSVVRGSEHHSPTGFHRDNGHHDLENNINADCRYGVLMYLNGDFDGGEICYPELGIEYKPRPGLLLIHFAGNMHGVNPVSNGTRYSMTSFAWGMNSSVNELASRD
jgi:hypothetical protein